MKKIWWKFIAWLDEHMPEWCALCQYVGFKKNMKRVPTTVGRSIILCPKCHDREYHPYSSR